MRAFAMTAILAMAALSPARAGVDIYATREGGGENTYATQYGRAADWIVACTEQIAGAAPGTRWCSLQPTSGRRFGAAGFFETARGLEVELWRHAADEAVGETALVDLAPVARLAPLARYAVECGGVEIPGLGPIEGGRRTAYGGLQAAAVIAALSGEEACAVSVVDGARRERIPLSLAGFGEALAHAAAFTGVELN